MAIFYLLTVEVPRKHQKKSIGNGSVAWLTPKEITSDYAPLYVSYTERSITIEGLESSAAKLMPPNTVFLTKRAPVGAVAVAAVPMATNQGFLNFVCGPKLNPLFLAFWLRANTAYLNAVANGSTYPELYKSDLFELEMSVPSLEEQGLIVDAFLAIQRLIFSCSMAEQSATTAEAVRHIQERTRQLIRLRAELAPYLLTGRLSRQVVSAARNLALDET